jgi:hypothetical protein
MPVAYLERLTDSHASMNFLLVIALLIIVNLKIKLIYT